MNMMDIIFTAWLWMELLSYVLLKEMLIQKLLLLFCLKQKSDLCLVSLKTLSHLVHFPSNAEFSRVLANQMDYYSHNPAVDKINQIKNQLEKTKRQMNENIEKLITREEKINLLVGKTTPVADQSKLFQRQSKQVQWKIMLGNVKQFMFLVLLGLIILYLSITLFCGITLRQCV